MTDEGQALYQSCGEILQRYYSVCDMAEQFSESPSGRLSLEMPDALGTCIVLPHLNRFRQQYPLISLNLILRQASFQEVSEELDVAIVSGLLPDSSVVCRRLGDQVLRPYASRDYLDQWGAPETPRDLAEHQCILMQSGQAPETSQWIFQQGQDVTQLPITGVIAANDIPAIKQLVLEGLGISLLQDFLVAEEVSRGDLVPLLPDYNIPPVPVYVIYPERKLLSPKIRAMVDFLGDCFARGLKPPQNISLLTQ